MVSARFLASLHLDSKNVKDEEGRTVCHVDATCVVDMLPLTIYETITDPGNRAVFKSIKRVVSRDVIEDDGEGRQTVDVVQVSEWRFLFFRYVGN